MVGQTYVHTLDFVLLYSINTTGDPLPGTAPWSYATLTVPCQRLAIIASWQQDPSLAQIRTLTDAAGAPIPGTAPRCYAFQVTALLPWIACPTLAIGSFAQDVSEADDIEEWED
jgi:hypothetical protein